MIPPFHIKCNTFFLFLLLFNYLYAISLFICLFYLLFIIFFYSFQIFSCPSPKSFHFITEKTMPAWWGCNCNGASCRPGHIREGLTGALTMPLYVYLLTLQYKSGGLVQPIQRMHPVLHICLPVYANDVRGRKRNQGLNKPAPAYAGMVKSRPRGNAAGAYGNAAPGGMADWTKALSKWKWLFVLAESYARGHPALPEATGRTGPMIQIPRPIWADGFVGGRLLCHSDRRSLPSKPFPALPG